MAVPVVTFFNNKGGVGKTSLVYHLSWMLSEADRKVLVCDLDPQANLSAAFLDEDLLETLWNDESSDQEAGKTIFRCVRPLMQVTDLLQAQVQQITPNLTLIPGDLSLAGFEDTLSGAWPDALGSDPFRSFRLLTAFSTIMQQAAENTGASVILADVGPNLGAINRSAPYRYRLRCRPVRCGFVLPPRPAQPWPHPQRLARRMGKAKGELETARFPLTGRTHEAHWLRGATARNPFEPPSEGLRQVGEPNAGRIFKKPTR